MSSVIKENLIIDTNIVEVQISNLPILLLVQVESTCLPTVPPIPQG